MNLSLLSYNGTMRLLFVIKQARTQAGAHPHPLTHREGTGADPLETVQI